MIIDLNKIFLLLAAARIIRANEMRVKWRNPVTDSPAPTPLPYYVSQFTSLYTLIISNTNTLDLRPISANMRQWRSRQDYQMQGKYEL